MKNLLLLSIMTVLLACNSSQSGNAGASGEFQYVVDRFDDIKVIRYQIPQWEKLTLQQKKYVYYLTQAGYAGRDIIWDQNYRHNLTIRKALEQIITRYKGDKTDEDWKNFMLYTKKVWFAGGIHHHYSMDKFTPQFRRKYFQKLLAESGATLSEEIQNVIFDPTIDNKKVSLDPNKDLLLSSATNFYGAGVSEKEASAFYDSLVDKNDATPISYGLNSQLTKDETGVLYERPWKIGGMYSAALEKMVDWLEKAAEVAENQAQADALKLLIRYYQTGDLAIFDQYCIAWVQATKGDIDYINGFIEVYNDPIGFKGSYENITQIKDFEMTEKMAVLAENAQWFEDNAPIADEHKKADVKGVTYKVVNVAGESGDASPSTPVGVNLPNANWIRVDYGSKSVSLGNITNAYKEASGGELTEEFTYSEKIIERMKEYGKTAGKMHTAMHEVLGHASGIINEGVGTLKETLKNYANTLEEARADLFSLYYMPDKKLEELGLAPSPDMAKAQYDGYIQNGLVTQLIRIKLGNNIEQAHMRNRQLVSKWVYEKGKADNVIEKKTKDGKTYFVVNDYDKLRVLFGELLKEIQRIKSEGDYAAGRALVETYGVKIDAALHKEILDRVEPLNIAPYGGFVNPKLVPVEDANGTITDIQVTYPESFEEQMLDYSKEYGFLPTEN